MANATDLCAAKIGKPDIDNGMEVCGRPVIYLTAYERGNLYSGWHHADVDYTDHHAVPKSWVS